MNKKQLPYIKQGRLFGYPDCCIKNFLIRLETPRAELQAEDKRKLHGTGFVPCPHCNQTKTEEELLTEINQNRIWSIPFPKA